MATKGRKSLDLSSKDIYLVVYFQEGDPGSKFDIYHRSKIVGNPETSLKKWAQVCIICASWRCYGIVAEVSDDLDYLKRKLDAIKEEFLVDYCRNAAILEKANKSVVVKEFIKIADKGTQTEDDQELFEMQGKYEALKLKYEDLKNAMDTIYNGVENSLGHIGRRLPSRRRSDSSVSDSNDSKVPKIEEVSPSSTPRRNVLAPNENTQSNEMLLGSGGSTVPQTLYKSINWNSYTAATRKLLMALFDRSVLATHSLTGKPSPAFIGTPKQAKEKLDPLKVGDIVEVVSAKCGVSPSLVRGAITTKCADENKMLKKRMEKDKENAEPSNIKRCKSD